jgi:hypothetical protein
VSFFAEVPPFAKACCTVGQTVLEYEYLYFVLTVRLSEQLFEPAFWKLLIFLDAISGVEVSGVKQALADLDESLSFP